MLFAYSLFAFFELVRGDAERCYFGKCSLNTGLLCNSNGNRKVLSLTGTFDVNQEELKTGENLVYVDFFDGERSNTFGKIQLFNQF